jgi:phage gpG-like protein
MCRKSSRSRLASHSWLILSYGTKLLHPGAAHLTVSNFQVAHIPEWSRLKYFIAGPPLTASTFGEFVASFSGASMRKSWDLVGSEW